MRKALQAQRERWYLTPSAWPKTLEAGVRDRTLLLVRPGAMLPAGEPPRATRSKRG
jgi:hypothetical protein